MVRTNIFLILVGMGIGVGASAQSVATTQRFFTRNIRPLFSEYCLKCHSTEKHKGELDLERFTSLDNVKRHPKVWQRVIEQLADNEMPPEGKPQPKPAEKARLSAWASAILDELAQAHAGDPGPVVLRRLNNVEYTCTVRDLTGVDLDPAREFPADSAAGEGFMNTGNALVMSPSFLTKYLDAGKEIATHAVLLPDGLRFSAHNTPRDWTEEKLAAIRAFYDQFTVNGGGTDVNLQGIKFDTKDGGVLPLQKYLAALLTERNALQRGAKTIADVARDNDLNPKYLGAISTALHDSKTSLVLDSIRARWRTARPDDAAALAATITQWEKALWRFTTVGHIGKRDGPAAWQVPVSPLSSGRELRMKTPAPTAGKEVTLYLATSDAGDGNDHDFAVWENPRFVLPGQPDISLRDVRAAVLAVTTHREELFSNTTKCLAAAVEADAATEKTALAQLAQSHGVEAAVLSAWLNLLGIGAGAARIDSYITQKMESAQSYDFIKGWTGADALSVIANSSDQAVRIPGNMKPHGVAVHPSPKLRVIVGWRSPVAAALRVEGVLQHAHPECGNGVTWTVELRRGQTRQRLASGTAQGAKEVKFGPFEQLAVQPGDVVSVSIGPRDGNHSCDLTAVDLKLSDATREWNLAREISPNILAGNPHADSFGNASVWHFYSEPDDGSGKDSVLPPGSLLAKWQSSGSAEEKQRLAAELQRLLTDGPAGLTNSAPDALLYRQITSLSSPLVTAARNSLLAEQSKTPSAADAYGLDPAVFGRHPNGDLLNTNNLYVQAPSLLEVRLPAELLAGFEFVATGTLHPGTGAEGSVQMQVLTTKPSAMSGLTAGAVQQLGGKRTWSDGELPVVSDSPIIVSDGSATRKRIEAALEEFRQLFPAALCYTKSVPVDEVVTLTLFYREDNHLRRLMLDDAQAAELDRLWSELHYVSQDPLKLVDAFEQLWQFATQDADPSAFTPMREPIKQRAEAFKQLQLESQPKHVEAVLKFAGGAYRRPLTEAEQEELRALYRKLREQELPHDETIRLMLARVLVAPAFLYRSEKPGPGTQPGPVNDWELASRLSYFLWSSAPDAELRGLAASEKLHDPEVLVAQTRRMLRDPRVQRLATEFGCAWLHIHGFDELNEKSERHFPTFADLRGDMYEESIHFFTDFFQNDRSVLGLLDADYTFLNDRLAKHYGVPGMTGTNWQRVDGMKKFSRGGILGQAAILAKQSGASRTSPILRGNWVAEVLLGEKLPRPPKDVPRLPEDEATETLTVRQLTEKHTTDPKCYGCHKRIDAFGYTLESFDAIGRWRERDLGDRQIDTRAKVLDGTELNGSEGLRDYLLTKRRDAFLKQFCRKLLGYSLGRAVQLSDGPLLTEMHTQLKANDYRIGVAVELIVRSRQFREIRGREAASDE